MRVLIADVPQRLGCIATHLGIGIAQRPEQRRLGVRMRRPGQSRGQGAPETRLRERHAASDFIGKTL